MKRLERTIKGEDGKEIPKKLHDYSGEELDQLADEDPQYESDLWSDAEIEAINNPENHEKSN